MMGGRVKRWDKFLRDSPEVVKRRVRKGIPDSMRALVWPTFLGGFERKKQFPALYQTLLAQVGLTLSPLHSSSSCS
jgi:hypothetical protein